MLALHPRQAAVSPPGDLEKESEMESRSEPTFESLSEESKKAVLEAVATAEFFQNNVEPAVASSPEEMERLVANPLQYLKAVGCPGISNLSLESRNGLNEALSTYAASTQSGSCKSCATGVTLAFLVLAPVSTVLSIQIIGEIALAIARLLLVATGLVISVLKDKELGAGTIATAFMIEDFSTTICQVARKC